MPPFEGERAIQVYKTDTTTASEDEDGEGERESRERKVEQSFSSLSIILTGSLGLSVAWSVACVGTGGTPSTTSLSTWAADMRST